MEWNLNGWFSIRNPYNLEFKQNVIKCLDGDLLLDFLILPETHCHSDQKIEIDNFTVFQSNRKKSANSRRGSGGIAIAVRNTLLNCHEIVAIYENSYDGQIGLKLKNSCNDFVICVVCICHQTAIVMVKMLKASSTTLPQCGMNF